MAQPGALTRGFGGRALYVVETTEGVTPANPNLQKYSDLVSGASISLDPAAQEYRDLGSFDAAAFIPGLPVYGLKLNFVLHTNRATPVNAAINRLANNGLASHTIEVAVGLDGANPGYYTFRGAKAESASVKGEVGKAVLVEITYKALSCTVDAIGVTLGTGTRESAALGPACRFATSNVTSAGAQPAFITRMAELKVAHKLEIDGTDGQAGPKSISEGARTVTGTIDMSFDDGGVAFAASVMALTAADIVLNCGATGAPMFTAQGAHFDKMELDADTTSAYLKKNVSFTAPSVITGTVP